HPDHIRVHEISVPAFDAAGDPDRYPEAGDPWQPSKLYYTGFSMRRVRMLHEAYERRGEESPYQRWFERELPPETHFTTFVDELRTRVGAGPEQPGASASVQLVVTGGPDGEVRCAWMLEDGKLRDVRLESKPDADVVLTLGYADAVAVQRGELDPSVAFMQG